MNAWTTGTHNSGGRPKPTWNYCTTYAQPNPPACREKKRGNEMKLDFPLDKDKLKSVKIKQGLFSETYEFEFFEKKKKAARVAGKKEVK